MSSKGTRLIKRGGIWYIAWTNNSRGKSTGTTDRAEAERVMAEFIQNGHAGTPAGTYTIGNMLGDYMGEHIHKRAQSIKAAEMCVARLLEFFPHDRLARSLTSEDYIKYDRERQASDGTVRRELGVLSAAINYAVRHNRLNRADTPSPVLPPPPPPKERWLTIEEEEILIGACPQTDQSGRLTRIWRFLMLAMETAGRKTAIETLTWSQVDFVNGVINLNPIGRAQTRKRRATIRLSKTLRMVLERAYSERASVYVLDHPGDIRASFETLVKASGLKDVTPHVLRHTWATRAAQAGVPMREIADWLGDTIQTVERHYYKRSPHYLTAAATWREHEAGK